MTKLHEKGKRELTTIVGNLSDIILRRHQNGFLKGGIVPKGTAMITRACEEQKKIMILLQGHGVSGSIASSSNGNQILR